MGYKISSFLSVSRADGHEHFLYYLPARGMASLWLNEWVNSNFDRLASKLGPQAVLITAPDGQEAEFSKSGDQVLRLLYDSLDPVVFRGPASDLLHGGGPVLIVSRKPLYPEKPEEEIECAAINLSAYDPQRLAVLFDQVIDAVQTGADPLDVISGSEVGKGSPDYEYIEALELKPNIFGIGIDGNAVIGMLKKWRERRQDR
ncbi:MAG TPA: hypothetical protein VFS54_04950 [Solirubrobacterales bacterium]|nr:hypothetical protein [Solirubrobacterales bacterium]